MKNPKILPFGAWFQVYERAGRNFEKSQRILENRSYRGMRRIFENVQGFQEQLSGYLDQGMKNMFALWQVSSVEGTFTADSAEKAIKTMVNAIKNCFSNVDYSSREYQDNPNDYGKLISIKTVKTNTYTYTGATGNKVKTESDTISFNGEGLGRITFESPSNVHSLINAVNYNNMYELSDMLST